MHSHLEELATLLSNPLVSLEILPGSLDDWITTRVEGCKPPSPDFPFLYSNGNLGIPSKILYKLYIAAVGLFKSSRAMPEICRISTCTIVLANPAHQTALNARKRLVQSGDIHPEKELDFIEVIFRGSGDCARQSILWDYRRWLLKRIYVNHIHFRKPPGAQQWMTSADLQPLPDISSDAVSKELSIIRRACESHPRNYHAWAHWHYIVDTVNTQLSVDDASLNAYMTVLREEHNALRNWVDHHVSDHSAMHRLCNLSQLLVDLGLRYLVHHEDWEATSLATHAMSLIISYPSHESLWMYLRETMTLLSIDGKREIVHQIESASISRSHFAKRFFDWLGADDPQVVRK